MLVLRRPAGRTLACLAGLVVTMSACPGGTDVPADDFTPTATATPSPSTSPTDEPTSAATDTEDPGPTPTSTESATPSEEPTATASSTESASPTPSPTESETSSGQPTPTPTPAENEPPVAEPDEATVDEDDVVVIDALANDHDPDGDTLRLVGVDAPRGDAVITPGGDIAYSPAADDDGTVTLTYTITDGSTQVDGTVTVAITPMPDAPTARDDQAQARYGQDFTRIEVLDNDSDPDFDDQLTVVAVTQGAQGSVQISSDGLAVEYSAFPESSATSTSDSFTYTVEDSTGRRATATVRVTFTA